MKFKILPLLLFFTSLLFAQEEILPVGFSDEEKARMRCENFTPPVSVRGIEEPPPYPVRHMAEWEELQALQVTWRSYPEILTQIVFHAAQEVPVVVFCNNQNTMTSAQTALQTAGVNMANVQLVIAPNNSVWVRDYGPNCVYANEVEDLYFIDWVYNRPTRPLDDALPDLAGTHFNIPVYSTTQNPERLVNTGGNFMSDGLGTAFASKLILDENDAGNPYGAGPHDEAEIDAIMNDYMGLQRYIKMETLPYDAIHHIDMHMRLLDEETLLVGQYPSGISDGPQIEANIEYVLNNFNSGFDTPYKIVRIPQPPDFNGTYPPAGDYRTYTNAVFVNKTILLPGYELQYDTVAQRIYRENYPGYKLVTINCNDMIGASGALHCITKEVGTPDPLWIVHQSLPDIDDNELQGDYPVSAQIKHKSGIANAQFFYTNDTTQAYQPVELQFTGPSTGTWSGYIPHQLNGTKVFYYIRGEANSSKSQVRPLAAPEGYYEFTVNGQVSAVLEPVQASLDNIFPNPASALTVVPVNASRSVEATIEVVDVLGRKIETLFEGRLPKGGSKHFLHAENYPSGTYFVVLKAESNLKTQRLVVE
ncbi:MAG: agmatine deiminase family protein [Bacteroidetes bacterium]|nr:agmatine deiminase family protein [Bacteroidota bacterium]